MFNKDQPAMPCIVDRCEVLPAGDTNIRKWYEEKQEGLTKREMFVMYAMQGLIAAGGTYCPSEAIRKADETLKELDNEDF